jgi:S-ribosylhomocysteine lyase
MTENAPNTESFKLDHTKVHAPYLRRVWRKDFGPEGGSPCLVCKFDLRVTQPNREYMTTGAMHTLEHLVSEHLYDPANPLASRIIDFSPMGCRTGFYFEVAADLTEEDVLPVITAALEGVLRWEGPIPGAAEVSCGNYRDHDLEGAKAWARHFLTGIAARMSNEQ